MMNVERCAIATSPVPAENQILKLTGITKRFGPLVAVSDISLSVGRHEVIGLIGENGAGKSTLLKVLTGVYQPDEGGIEVNGRSVVFRSPQDASANGIGIVHQEQSLFTNLTVAENMAMGARSGGGWWRRVGLYRWRQLNLEAAQILARIGSSINPKTRLGELSFAQRQMVEIGRTIQIACESIAGQNDGGAPLVILDEPTSVLEKHETEVLKREVRELKKIGSVIFVSHRLEEVLDICDRIVVMRHGKIIADRPNRNIDRGELFKLMIGRAVRAKSRPEKSFVRDAAPILSADGISRRGSFRNVSFSVRPGHVLAIVGTVGSGREELCRAIFGEEDIEQGRLSLNGRPVRNWSVRKAVRAGIAYLPAERGVEAIVGGMTAARNLMLVKPGASKAGPFLSPRSRSRMAKDWFERLDVRPRNPELELSHFSGGNQQKVALAKWLVDGAPKVLILDHPLRGLDPGASEIVNGRILECCRAGSGVILLADTLEEALELGNEIIVMRDGVVTARFDLACESPTSLDLLEKMV